VIAGYRQWLLCSKTITKSLMAKKLMKNKKGKIRGKTWKQQKRGRRTKEVLLHCTFKWIV